MMSTTTKLYARAGATAIAAVLALFSTQLAAQEAPAATQPAPAATTTPPATPDTTPTPTTDTSTTVTPTDSEAPTTSTAVARPRTAAARPARTLTRTRTVTRTAATVPSRVTTHTVHASVASTPAAPPPAAAPATESQSTVKPIVDTTPAPPRAAAKAAPSHPDNTALEVGAGALALLAIGGGAWALSRRRRHEEEFADEAYEPEAVAEAEPVEPAPVAHEEQPAIVAPSAFAWGNQPAASDDGSDRRPGESWVERAYRGPSPANPSVSLRARLKRAAFFDKREREVAAGTAEPVETDAGLPEAMVDEQEREFA